MTLLVVISLLLIIIFFSFLYPNHLGKKMQSRYKPHLQIFSLLSYWIEHLDREIHDAISLFEYLFNIITGVIISTKIDPFVLFFKNNKKWSGRAGAFFGIFVLDNKLHSLLCRTSLFLLSFFLVNLLRIGIFYQ